MTDSLTNRLRDTCENGVCVLGVNAHIVKCDNCEAADEIERLREWKAVANMFGECFRMDEFGQSPVSDGQDVFQATLAWERLRTKEARHD